jgi:hypothetical protein
MGRRQTLNGSTRPGQAPPLPAAPPTRNTARMAAFGGWHAARTIIAPRRISRMLWTIFVVLLVLWLLGMVSSYTLGGFIHILLVIAIAVVLIRVIQGRRPV